MKSLMKRSLLLAAAILCAAGSARAQGTVCDSPCKFILLPILPVPSSAAVPNISPLPELQGRVQGTQQYKLPFIVQQLSSSEMPLDANTFFDYQVDKRVVPARRSIAPAYPDSLKRAKVNGEVVAKFVVDTSGRVTIESIEILSSTNQLFAIAVLEALPRMKFSPAELNKKKVSQVVQQPFIFHTKQ
jgi:TonB family protein